LSLQLIPRLLLLFFFSFLLLPPFFTLFPYTTLFRSDLLRAGASVVTTGDHIWDQKDIMAFLDLEPRLLRPLNYPDGRSRRGSRPDRKSTRLNSSHVAISYAVFCLKKKNRALAHDLEA